jgi:BirA family biotin operon repressor/biotin-[acetyl-CoA-carboxylase] ligase
VSTVDLERLPDRLATRALGRSVVILSETRSTMDDARTALIAGAPDGHLVVADHQTEGRGTHGRTWSSPAGQDLYFSFIARPKMPIERLPTMALAVGLGLARAVAALVHAGVVDAGRVRLKWPNDVLVDGHKCAGILVETRATNDGVDGVIVGVGLNCNRRDLDVAPEAAAATTLRATSLALATGLDRDRDEVLSVVLASIEDALYVWQNEPLAVTLSAVDAWLAFRGERVRLDGAESEGTLVGLADDGGLRIATDSGERSFQAGRLERLG